MLYQELLIGLVRSNEEEIVECEISALEMVPGTLGDDLDGPLD